MDLNLNQIKLQMLNEFELNFTTMFNDYFDKNISLNELINQNNQLTKIWEFIIVDFKYEKLENSIQFLEYEKTTKISHYPTIKNKNSFYCKLESNNNNLNFMFKCKKKDKITLCFKPYELKNSKFKNNKFINLNEFSANKNNIITKDTIISKNENYIYEKQCENDEILSIKLKFENIFDYFPLLRITLTKDTNSNEILSIYKNISNYIKNEKSFLKNLN
ncbi:MAG: hypothetical protein E7Z80_00455 [Methanobrevibacter thaueri]|nr:hypothetical protein [Methanobrevibacter thaueri]